MYIFRTPPIKKIFTHISILEVPTTQLAKMSIDPKFVELTADVVKMYICNIVRVRKISAGCGNYNSIYHT